MEWAPSLPEAQRHHRGQVVTWNRQNAQWYGPGPGRGLGWIGVNGVQRTQAEKETEERAAGVSHKDARRGSIEPEEARQRSHEKKIGHDFYPVLRLFHAYDLSKRQHAG